MHGTIGNKPMGKTHLGRMFVMDVTGHTTIEWNSEVAVETEVARASFDKLTKAGYQAFSVGDDDERGARMKSFDPTAEKILMVPQLVGG
jgi:hypothetical protein